MSFVDRVPEDWRERIDAAALANLAAIEEFVGRERKDAGGEIYPKDSEVFAALERTRFDAVRVVILGMDPYHHHGQAHGLAFSLRPGARPFPSSLKNILVEVERDYGAKVNRDGNLTAWADGGVLLLNASLTIRRATPGSHLKVWRPFTDAVIKGVNKRPDPVIFMLWGAAAQRKRRLIESPHKVLERSHPSGRSAWRNFTDTRPFSECNRELVAVGRQPIDWHLP